MNTTELLLNEINDLREKWLAIPTDGLSLSDYLTIIDNLCCLHNFQMKVEIIHSIRRSQNNTYQ